MSVSHAYFLKPCSFSIVVSNNVGLRRSCRGGKNINAPIKTSCDLFIQASRVSNPFGKHSLDFSSLHSSIHLHKHSSGKNWNPCLRHASITVRASGETGDEDTKSKSDGISKIQVEYNPMRTSEQFAKEHDPEQKQRLNNLNLFSPSKVNLFLRITAKRPDGYHELASLFHCISLGDVLKFSISPSKTRDSLTTTAPGVPVDGSNLVIKAFNLYRKKTGVDTHFWVHLEKKVPTGAGLGGGSGNAATALWAANQMCGQLATEKELQEWSAEIGSDIPFFFSNGAAFCSGRGEVVEDLGTPVDLDTPLVLMKPKEECSTAEVYQKFKLDLASSADPQQLLDAICKQGISQQTSVNDLEAPAFEVLPSLKRLKQRVMAASRGRYKAVFMSGSGSTIVGVGAPDPPPFIYDEPEYDDVFVSEAYFLTRRENEWYKSREMSSGAMSTDNKADAMAALSSGAAFEESFISSMKERKLI